MKTLRILLAVSIVAAGLLSGCCPFTAASGDRTAGNGDRTAGGAIRGAGVGGDAGAAISRRMDDQADEIRRDLKDAEVEREGEGIKITFDSGLLFETNSSELTSASKENLRNLARVLNKYPDTELLVEGDTDSTGTEQYNQELSERRAGSVAGYLRSLDVRGSRISTVGLGERQPIATNGTEEGRRQNRRVEIAIFAGDAMIRDAKAGKLK